VENFCLEPNAELYGRIDATRIRPFSRLKGRVRGKYAERYRAGTNLVLLEDDVQAAFPTAEAVNEALRILMKVARRQTQKPV
jgi:hypothetical protein